ncbi:MAG: hypothetical protein KF901_27135 [Myxococcales bacterium]|nr:hypothetical protein [Myxococcales bacterium]
MTTTVEAINKKPTQTFSRAELQDTMDGWLEANRKAEAAGDWVTYLGPFYTDDAVYRWNIGPNEEFVARGRREIEDVAIGYQMKGFEGWSYPYTKVLIDEQLGELVAFWRQVAPVKREDGSDYEVDGLCGSWFRYGGNGKWSEQRDFFDFGNVFSLLAELAADGHLNPVIKQKIQVKVKSKTLMRGHEHLRPPTKLSERLRQGAAVAKIVLFGR